MARYDSSDLNEQARVIEAARDRIVRTVACPICAAPPGRMCTGHAHTSHTGRYNQAVVAGLVASLPGWLR